MNEKRKADYDALDERLAGPGQLRVGEVRTGGDAAAAGRDFLLQEYGSDKAIADAVRTGRPRVGEPKRGESPTVRARIADADYMAFKELETELGRKQSELVREAVHLLLQHHNKLAS